MLALLSESPSELNGRSGLPRRGMNSANVVKEKYSTGGGTRASSTTASSLPSDHIGLGRSTPASGCCASPPGATVAFALAGDASDAASVTLSTISLDLDLNDTPVTVDGALSWAYGAGLVLAVDATIVADGDVWLDGLDLDFAMSMKGMGAWGLGGLEDPDVFNDMACELLIDEGGSTFYLSLIHI